MKKPIISFPDFQKIELRIGEIKEAQLMEGSKKMLELKVDLGEDYGIVEILSGIAKYYNPQDIIGKKYVFIANLEPRQIMGKSSNGMILAMNSNDKPLLVEIDKEIKNGTLLH